MGEPLDGKALAAELRTEVAERVRRFAAKNGRAPGLDVVLVGEDPASVVYTRSKEKTAREVGISSRLHRLPASATEADVLAQVRALNADANVDGILVQLPLPDAVRAEAIIDAIDPRKDVDGFHEVNAGRLARGRASLVPCTPRGCLKLLAKAGAKLEGASAVVVGRSNIVGRPMAELLVMANATVTIAHSRTRDLAAVCRGADVLVVAVGKRELIGADHVREGAIVIDVGIHRGDDGKLRGDVRYDEVLPRASFVTPVPGGVGPMTIACLLENTLIAAEARVG